jgi:hypothetical protein
MGRRSIAGCNPLSEVSLASATCRIGIDFFLPSVAFRPQIPISMVKAVEAWSIVLRIPKNRKAIEKVCPR